MREYYFPSGIPVAGFDATPWIKALEISFGALLIGALGVFVWRCFRQASLRDAAGWGLFFAAECLSAWIAVLYFQRVQDRFSPWQVWTPALLASLGLAFLAVNLTVLRCVNNSSYNLGLLFLEAIALFYVCFPSLGVPRVFANRTNCKNNLKQIGLAMQNYHDAWQTFPAAGGTTDTGAKIWTWRVALLPYLDHEERQLHQEFRLDEPWNSTFNTTLQDKCPPVYRCPAHPAPWKFTAYALPCGPHTIGGDGLTALNMNEITDGTSHTFLVVEACGREILWTEPRDVEVIDESLGVNLPGDQPGRSRGMLSSYHAGGAHVLYADGSVRYTSEQADKSVLKALSTRNQAEPVPEFWDRQ